MAAPSADSALRRRIIAPIVAQLRQGTSPSKIALTVALGLVIGVFPILGATTLLCGAAGVWLRLNQPVIQLVNYVAYPLQLGLLIPFYRAGESLFGRPHLPLSIPMLADRFRADTGQFFSDFGFIAISGIVVWCLVAPVAALTIYAVLHPPVRALAARARRDAPEPA